jgi:PAS domain-containing protein
MNDRSKRNRLRKKAEIVLSKKKEAPRKICSAEMEKLIHELQVHQVELEMQNDELRKAQEEIERSRSKYVDLYDFAPVGYFTPDKKGVIIEANLTGASLLEVEGASLLRTPFSYFRIISKLVDRIFHESLARPRKARQIAPQASAGYCWP